MNKEQLFKRVFDQVLDYTDRGLLGRCAKWGLNTYDLLEKNKMILGTTDTRDAGIFIYAVSTAVIVGELSNRAFGDHNFFDEHEFDITLLDLHFEDIKGYLDGYPDVDPAFLEKLRTGSYLHFYDFSGTVAEYKKEIYKGLVETYKLQGQSDPDYKIYESLMKIFEEQGAKTKEVFVQPTSFSGELSAHAYIGAGFDY